MITEVGMPRWFGFAMAALVGACGGGGSPRGAPPAAPPGAPPAASAPVPTASPPEEAAPAARGPEPCGALNCRWFDTPEAAFEAALEGRPLVLAIGESHALKGTEGIQSTTRRFTESLLPLLAGRASDLVLELWIPDKKCKKKQVDQVAKQQKRVTEKQAAGNQNEFLTLGNTSKALGVQPHVLIPSCEEYDAIVKAGPDGIGQMLEMIARLTAVKTKVLLERNTKAAGETPKMVITYGGAMHNDLKPRPGREAWSYGPQLSAHTGGKYVELDLIVPQFIRDTPAWKALEWYPHFDAKKAPKRTTLYEVRPGSYTLIFPSER